MEKSVFKTPVPDEGITIIERLRMVQAELKAPKNLYNSFAKFNYRNLESILEAVKPLLVKYGLTMVITDEVVMVGARYYVKAQASVSDGKDSLSVTAWAREDETKKGASEAQITGACSSYARKYAASGLFLLDDQKDPDTDEFQRQSGEKPKEEKSGPTTIHELLKDNGIREDFICNAYHIGKVDDLTAAQIKGIYNNLVFFRQKQDESDGNKGKT